MPPHHFMASDFAGILAGFCLFAFVAFVPGYALGWLTDVVRFRQRVLRFQLAMSVPLSIAIGPVIVYLAGSLKAASVFYGVLCVVSVLLVVRTRPSLKFSKTDFGFLGIVAMWIAIALLSLADLQMNGRLYFSIVDYDYAVRTAFTNAIETSGIPAQSPFFFPGHPVALRYHYYWLLLCALVSRAGGPLVDARQAMAAGTIWCGIGIICMVPLYLRLFSPKGAVGLAKRTMIGVSLLAVTGLDILPTLLMLWLYSKRLFLLVYPSVEMWNEQIDGWVCTMLWEPHYLASVIACFTGFLILWDVPAGAKRWRRIVSGIIAGLAFATAVGSGIYVAFVFALFLTAWTAITIVKRWRDETAVLFLAGAVAIAASMPFLRGLRGPGAGGSFVHLTVRSFRIGEVLLTSMSLDRPWQLALGNLAFLPLNYALELGVFGAAGLLAWKQFRGRNRAATRQELAAFTLVGVSIAVCTFLRSGVITSNDLGWRGFLIAQFVLLIWAAELFSAPIARGNRALLAILLVLGAAGVVYDVAMTRFFPLLSDAGLVPKLRWLASDEQLGKRTYANREAYEWLRARTSSDAIIQQNPDPAFQDTFYGLYGLRRTVAEDTSCGAVFGGDPAECAPVVQRLTKLYSPGGDLEDACASLPIDIVVAKDTDAAWKDPSSWEWSRTPIFANGFVRLFTCSRR